MAKSLSRATNSSIDTTKKLCKACGEVKHLDDFYRANASRRRAKCKSCMLAANLQRCNLSRKLREFKQCCICGETKATSDFNNEQSSLDGKSARCKTCNRLYNVKWKYGITAEEYNIRFQAQGGKCAICHQTETQKSRWGQVYHLSVDHNHSTGKVRGLLCRRCNLLVADLEHPFDPDLPLPIVEAMAYLSMHSADTERAG